MSAPAKDNGPPLGSEQTQVVDFLPRWYPRFLRWKVIVRLHVWMLALTIVAVSAIGFGAWSEVADAQLALTAHQSQVDESRHALLKMKHFRDIEQKLGVDEKVIARLGLTVEASRVLTALDQAVTPSISLKEVQMEASEQLMPLDEYVRLAGKKASPANRPKQRQLRVNVKGVAPTGTDVAIFTQKLATNPAITRGIDFSSREIESNGRVMREFNVGIRVNLDYVPLN